MFNNKLIFAESKDGLVLLSILLVLITTAISSCSSSTRGRLQSSSEVTRVFEKNQVLSDHQYYVSGFQRIPYGIIGIDNRYKLRSSRWKPIDLNPTLLNQLAYRMDHVYSTDPSGAWILDQEGKRIGIWYSSRTETKVRIEKDNYVVVVSPEPPELSGIP